MGACNPTPEKDACPGTSPQASAGQLPVGLSHMPTMSPRSWVPGVPASSGSIAASAPSTTSAIAAATMLNAAQARGGNIASPMVRSAAAVAAPPQTVAALAAITPRAAAGVSAMLPMLQIQRTASSPAASPARPIPRTHSPARVLYAASPLSQAPKVVPPTSPALVTTTRQITQQPQQQAATPPRLHVQRLWSAPQASTVAGSATRRTSSARLAPGNRAAVQAVMHQGTSSPRLPTQQWIMRVGSSTPRLPLRGTNTATHRAASQPRHGRWACSGTAIVPTPTTTTTAPTTPANGGCMGGSPRQPTGHQRLLLEPVVTALQVAAGSSVAAGPQVAAGPPLAGPSLSRSAHTLCGPSCGTGSNW